MSELHDRALYTIDELRAKIASNDYGAELCLQHAMARIDELMAENEGLTARLRELASAEPAAYGYPNTAITGSGPTAANLRSQRIGWAAAAAGVSREQAERVLVDHGAIPPAPAVPDMLASAPELLK